MLHTRWIKDQQGKLVSAWLSVEQPSVPRPGVMAVAKPAAVRASRVGGGRRLLQLA